MSPAKNPPVAVMTAGGTTNEAESLGVAPVEGVTSESEQSSPTDAPMTAGNAMAENEKMGLVPFEATASDSEDAENAHEPDTNDSILPKAESIGLESMNVPSSPPAILTFPYYPEIGRYEPQVIIGRFIVQLMKPRELTTNERQVVFNILKSLSQIETFTRAAEERLQIKFMLAAFLGVWEKASRPYEFPEVFQTAATAILTKVEEDLDIEEVVDETPPAATSTPSTSTGRKRTRRDASSRESETPDLPALSDPSIRRIMHNLVLTEGNRRVYRLLDKSATRPCNVFGHNGLTVGQWWPYRICALRDGAHGATQGGIAGSALSGAYSVVVSGDYDELDRDEKDVLYYSGSDSTTNVDPVNPIITHHTKALRQSFRDARQIRVLRTSAGRAAHCPSKGIRYDGLYRIISEGIAVNGKGGAYVRFVLVREGNQAEIDLSRPTQAERDVFDRLKSSV